MVSNGGYHPCEGKGDWLDVAFDASNSQRLPVQQLLLQAPSPIPITTARSILSSNHQSPSHLILCSATGPHTNIHKTYQTSEPEEQFVYPSNHNNMALTFRSAAHPTEDPVGNFQLQWGPTVILLKHDLCLCLQDVKQHADIRRIGEYQASVDNKTSFQLMHDMVGRRLGPARSDAHL
jgi:hypothetical protein